MNLSKSMALNGFDFCWNKPAMQSIFRLDRCENGLDTSTESGKVQLLKRVVSVLAEIQNPLEREVYLSRTANKWEISAEVLHQQVDRTIRSKRRLEATKEWKDIIELGSSRTAAASVRKPFTGTKSRGTHFVLHSFQTGRICVDRG